MMSNPPPATHHPLPFSRYRPIIDDWVAFQAAVQRPLPTTIWANPLKTTPAQLSNLLRDGDVPHQPIDWVPGAFRLPADLSPGLRWEYITGLYHVQEEVSLLPVRFLDVQPGQRVLDLCAAPGNKTAQMALRMENRGTIVANDRNAGRMRAARQTFNRLGVINVTTLTADGANLPGAIGHFDRVLADVPCTCEGNCRRDTSLLTRALDPQQVTGAQTALLRKAIQLCKPNGRIVYSTCTFAPEENEQVVDALVRETGTAWQVVPVTPPPGFTVDPGLTAWQGRTFHPSLRHALRVWPHQNDTGGFFVAVLEKTGNAESAESAEEEPLSAPLHLRVEEERKPWLGIVTERFGFDPAIFDGYKLFRVGKRRLYLVNDDHLETPGVQPDAAGMHFMRPDGRYPKMTTGAAMLFGRHATRNVVPLTADQVAATLARDTIVASAGQLTACTDTGYVLLHHRGVCVGQGILLTNQDGSGRIQSQFPKAWSRHAVNI